MKEDKGGQHVGRTLSYREMTDRIRQLEEKYAKAIRGYEGLSDHVRQLEGLCRRLMESLEFVEGPYVTNNKLIAEAREMLGGE